MQLTLYRHAYLPTVTRGRLYASSLILPTLEEPWRPNPDGPGGSSVDRGQLASCIPDGNYRVIPHRRGKDGADVWALVNVDLGVYYRDTDIPDGQKWGRSFVLIHRGNTTNDIEGCILVGMEFGRLAGLDAVLNSGDAIRELQAVLGHTEEHFLRILPTTGTTERGVP